MKYLFSKLGRQRNKNGNTVNWWTDQTLANYLERAQCFIDQYSNYTVPSGSHVSVFLLSYYHYPVNVTCFICLDQRSDHSGREHCRQRRSARGFPRLQFLRCGERSRAPIAWFGAVHFWTNIFPIIRQSVVRCRDSTTTRGSDPHGPAQPEQISRARSAFQQRGFRSWIRLRCWHSNESR